MFNSCPNKSTKVDENFGLKIIIRHNYYLRTKILRIGPTHKKIEIVFYKSIAET